MTVDFGSATTRLGRRPPTAGVKQTDRPRSGGFPLNPD